MNKMMLTITKQYKPLAAVDYTSGNW